MGCFADVPSPLSRSKSVPREDVGNATKLAVVRIFTRLACEFTAITTQWRIEFRGFTDGNASGQD